MKPVSGSTRRKRLAITGTTFFLACFLVFCGRPGDVPHEEHARDLNVLRIDVNGPLKSLNPMADYHCGSGLVNVLLYSCLFSLDEKGALQPDLAAQWTYDPSIPAWDIQLRKDASFHDGKPVTSKDVKYSLNEWLKKDTVGLQPVVRRVEIVTDHSIRVVLKDNDPEFPKKVCHLEIVPQSEGAQIDCFNHPVGSGPFKFQGRNADREVELVAHEAYHEGRPSLERVVFFYESDSEKSWSRLLQGQTDVVQGVYPKDYEMIEKYRSRFLFDLNPYERYALVLYNLKSPLFSDPKVRLALAHAIDKEYIVKNLLGGFGMVANGPMGVDSPFHDPTVKPIPCDRRKSLELFREAGWVYDDAPGCLLKDGRSFQFTILVFRDNQLDRRVAEYLKLCLNDLGVKMHIKTVPFELLVEKYVRNDGFEAVLTELKGAYIDPEVLLGMWSPGPSDCSGAGCFEHPEVTELLSAALAERDAEKKKELFYRLDTLMSSLQPGTFLYHKAMLGVMSKRVVLKVPFGNRYFSIRQFKDASVAGGSDY